MIAAVTHGKPNTAMQSFALVLSGAEIESVVDFIRAQFIDAKNFNSQYHTPENGWRNFAQYRDIFPFVTGEMDTQMPVEKLSNRQRQARSTFLNGCINCHERTSSESGGVEWEKQAVSYPRNGVSPQNLDTTSGATPFSRHDKPIVSGANSEIDRLGEKIFVANCVFCHARDGSGQNWIGQFLEPHPRDLRTRPIRELSVEQLKLRIANGVAGSAMPAWKTVLSDGELTAVANYVRNVIANRADK